MMRFTKLFVVGFSAVAACADPGVTEVHRVDQDGSTSSGSMHADAGSLSTDTGMQSLSSAEGGTSLAPVADASGAPAPLPDAAGAAIPDAGAAGSGALGPCPSGYECADIAAMSGGLVTATDGEGRNVEASCGMGAAFAPCDPKDPAKSCPAFERPFCVHLDGLITDVACGQRCTP